MANEITLSAQLAYADSDLADVALALLTYKGSITTKIYHQGKQSVATSQAALNLGAVSALGWFLAVNRDPTNFIKILTATAGTIMVKLLPGAPCLFYFGSGVTAPFVIADTATCILEYLLLSI